MKQKLSTKALAIILSLCLVVLGVVVYLLIPRECKHHFCDKTVNEPTCDTKGYTTYVCKKCEYTFEADFVAPLGHTYTSEVTAPTCEEQGYTTHTCSVCGYVKKDTIVAAKGHDYETKVTEPTCEADGYTTLTCKECDFVTVTDHKAALGHDLENTVTAPTCEAEGYTTSKCKSCDYEYISAYVNPIGHNLTKTVLTPTCTVQGYTTYKCQNCTHEYVSDYTKPAGHSFTTTIIAPTCEAQGYTTYKCANCDHSYTSDYTDPTGHSISKTVTNPTCESQGYTTHKCANCDYSYESDYTDPIGHSVIETEGVIATCTTKGYTKYECKICDYEYQVDNYPTGHSIIATVNTTPTYNSTGSTTYTCENCDYERTTYVSYFEIFTGAEGTGEGALAKGIDISKWSGKVDFEVLKSAGVDFVIIRVGSYTNKDPYFEEYYAGAKAAGLDVGAYFFTYAQSVGEAITDAYNVVEWLQGKQFEYPIFFDVEDDATENYYPSTFDEELITNMSHAFMSTVLSCGYYPGLYTNLNFLKNVFENDRVLSTYDVWFARYLSDPYDSTVLPTDEEILTNSKLYSMWQYAGNVPQYEGAIEYLCDLNYAFKDYPTIIKKYGFNGYGS